MEILNKDVVIEPVLIPLNKTYATSAEVYSARRNLESLLVWANHGIAISDFNLGANGVATAKIYAPTNVEITVNGKTLTGGTAKGNGVVYTVSETAKNFVVSAEGLTLDLYTNVTDLYSASTEKVVVYTVENLKEVVAENAQILVDDGKIKVGFNKDFTEVDYVLSKDQMNSATKSLIIVLDYDGTEKIELTVGVKGAFIKGTLDTFYIKPGENVLRIDRINDLNWDSLEEVKRITLVPEAERNANFNLTIKNVSVID